MPRFPRHHPSVQQRGRTSNRRISSGAPKALLNQRFRSGPHPCDSSARAPSQGRLAGAAPLAIMQSATPARMGIWSWRRNQEPNSTRRHFSPRRMAESPSPSTGRAQGDPADSVLYIREGRVKIAVVSDQGKEAVVAFLKAGDFIGEGCLTGRPRRISTARALEDSVISRVDKATMARILRDQPNFSERFTAHLLARTIRVEEDLVDQLFNSSEKRLARALLLLANFGKDGKQEPVIAKVSQETLADMIGTTRSRVSHFMNKFRQLGYVDYNGHLEVHSSLLDAVLHEKPQIKMPR